MGPDMFGDNNSNVQVKHGIVPLSSSVNFSDWKFRLIVLLEEYGVQECIYSEKPSKNTVKEDKNWDKMKSKCKSLIVQNLSDHYLEYIKDKSTPKQMFDTLTSIFERKGITTQLLVRKEILTLKFKEDVSLESHFLKFDDLIRKLKAAGADPSSNEIICCLLLSMPETYSNVVAILEALQEDKLELGLVKAKLLDEEKKKNNAVGKIEGETVAFHVKKNVDARFKCNLCGKQGHLANNCRGRSHYNNLKIDKKNITCFKCQKLGHFANECRNSCQNYNKSGNMSISFVTECLVNQKLDLNDNDQSSIKWIIDSGATDHLINNDSHFYNSSVLNNPINIRIAKNTESLQASRVGSVRVVSDVYNNSIDCIINDVLFVKNLRYNLLSVKKLEKNGFVVIFKDNKVKIVKEGITYAIGYSVNELYIINFKIISSSKSESMLCNDQAMLVNSNSGSFRLWHRRFGHLGENSMKQLINEKLVHGMQVDFSEMEGVCEACVQGKQTILPFRSARNKRRRMFELVHTDIVGPVTPESYAGEKYYITFIDDFSHFCVVFMLKSKAEAFDAFVQYVTRVENKFGTCIKQLRCDNGKEYCSNKFKQFCRSKGIYIQFTPPYTPQLNGTAERLNRTLNDKARSMLADSGVPKEYWSEAIYNAAYVLNRSPTTAVEGKTPSEIWYKSKPNVKNLRVFGSLCYVHITKAFRSKFDSKSAKCFFLSYGDNGYRVLNTETNKIVYSRNITFNEDKVYKDVISDDDNNVLIGDSDLVSTPVVGESLSGNTCSGFKNRDEISEHVNGDDDFHGAFSVDSYLDEVPKSIVDIKTRDDRKMWEAALIEELNSLKENNTWDVVERRADMNVISCRWVFTIKDSGSKKVYKARLVARGFQQRAGIDYSDIYTPVAKLTTIRIFLSLANYQNLFVHQMDVKSAFLNGELNETIYMSLPETLTDNDDSNKNLVCKLNKSLYGLKQAPKCWYEKFDECMLSLGFSRCKSDNCMYVLNDGTDVLFLLVYVDDVLIAGSDVSAISRFKENLKVKFKMKDLGEVNKFLGIEIERYPDQKIMTLHQKGLIEKIVNKFGIENCRSFNTPIEKNLVLHKCTDINKLTTKPYKQLIGCLMYVMLATRPDICYSVSYFSQFQNCASDEHYQYLLRVLKYLNCTNDYKLIFKADDCNLIGYCDADWANSTDRKSISGFCFKVFGSLVSWCSKKQSIVALQSSHNFPYNKY